MFRELKINRIIKKKCFSLTFFKMNKICISFDTIFKVKTDLQILNFCLTDVYV